MVLATVVESEIRNGSTNIYIYIYIYPYLHYNFDNGMEMAIINSATSRRTSLNMEGNLFCAIIGRFLRRGLSQGHSLISVLGIGTLDFVSLSRKGVIRRTVSNLEIPEEVLG
jgi:hypothetical protein